MWTVRDDGRDLNWMEADSRCAACRLGGHADWRWPSIEQLEGLYGAGRVWRTEFEDASANIAAPFELSSPRLWSGTRQGPSFALYLLYFTTGDREGTRQLAFRSKTRAVCVRAAEDQRLGIA